MYQPSPISPRSVGSGATRPTFAAPSYFEEGTLGGASTSSASVEMTEGGASLLHAGATFPAFGPSVLFRIRSPVMPCSDGGPPVPIVVSDEVGFTGSDPVAPESVPAPERIRERRYGHAFGSFFSSAAPTPLRATSSTSFGAGPPAMPGTATPERTVGFARLNDRTFAREGAMASSCVPSGTDAFEETPSPANTIGTLVSGGGSSAGQGETTSVFPARYAPANAGCFVIVMTSGDRPA